jgi:hypothetical protein
MTKYAQIFCTINDIIEDTQSAGADETRMLSAIREASDFIQKAIGWFIPVTQTLKFKAPEEVTELFIPPLLAVTEIINDYATLTASDYILKPDNGFWANGPYGKIVADPNATNLYTFAEYENGIQITGRWGKYEFSGSTGAIVAEATQQTAGQATLAVDDGSRISPGMVLLIGDEQELVTGWSTPTASVTALNGDVAVTDQIITVDNASLINIGEIIRVGFEQMKVKDRNTSTNKLSVLRQWNGTAQVAHTNNDAVDVYRTVDVERGMNGTIAAEHLKDVTVSRYFPPDDIVGLTKQIATLIINKAKSGYQGRVANADIGVMFYNDAFPRFEIERLKKSYMFKRVA